MLVRPPMTNLKMTVRADCAVSACSPHPGLYKLLPADCQWSGGAGFGQASTSPLLRVPASKIKHFPSYQPSLFSASEWRAARPLFQLHPHLLGNWLCRPFGQKVSLSHPYTWAGLVASSGNKMQKKTHPSPKPGPQGSHSAGTPLPLWEHVWTRRDTWSTHPCCHS